MPYQNFYATKLANAIGASDTSIDVLTPPSVTSGRLVIEPRNAQLREIIKYTGVTGTTLTGVTRGTGGTSAQPHAGGVTVNMNVTAADLQDLYDAFASFSASNNDWRPIPQTPVLAATNGNRSFNLSIPNDQTALLTKGMRLKIPRTGTTPTQSADFNGTTQYATKVTPTGLSFTNNYTCEAWINIDSLTAGVALPIGGRYNVSTGGFVLYLEGDGRVGLVGRNGANADYVTSNRAIPLGRWVHVAASMDLSTASAAVYIDGVAVSNTYNNSPATSIVQAGELQIGHYTVSTGFLDGRVSDFRIWSTVRTAQQIRDNMNQQLVGNEANLVGYWKLNGDFNDSTANANNLTAQAGATATFADNPFSSNAYAIVMSNPVFSAGNTTLTVQTPTGYPIPNQTLGALSYSGVKVPFGFPADPSKWILLAIANDLQLTGSVTTGAKDLGFNLLIPVGDWKIDFGAIGRVQTATATSLGLTVAISPTIGASADGRLNTFMFASSVVNIYQYIALSSELSLTSATTYNAVIYPYAAITYVAIGLSNYNGNPTISVQCAYL